MASLYCFVNFVTVLLVDGYFDDRISTMSADLIWELTKKHNSFLHRKNPDGTRFTREAGNVTNVHSYKYSGLANEKTVSVTVSVVDDVFD